MYVQFNWSDGRLFEIFATLGKGGGCAVCQSEALTRSITLGLKYGVPVSDYVQQVRGIRCPTPLSFPKDKAVLSCPDAIARALERYGSLSVDAVVGLLRGANGTAETEGAAAGGEAVELSPEDVAARVLDETKEREARGMYEVERVHR